MSEKRGGSSPEQLQPAPPVTKLRRRGEKTEPIKIEQKPWKGTFRKESGRLYMGDEYQVELLGTPQIDDDYQLAMDLFIEQKRHKEPIEKFINILRDHYKGDPTNPGMPFAADLQKKIAELAGLSEEQKKLVKFYSSVGIKEIDHDLGVDGWFDVGDKAGHHAVAAVDVTMKDVYEKYEDQRESRSEVLVIDQVPANPTDTYYQEAVDYYAERVLDRLKTEMMRYNLKWERLA